MALAGLQRAAPILREATALAFAPTRRNVLHWASWLVTLSVLLTATFVLRDGRVFGWEQEVERWVQQTEYPQWLFDVTTNRVTGAWEGALIALVVGLGLWALNQRLDAALVLSTFPLHVVANFPKALVDRERPSEAFEGIFGVGGERSFASGHSEFAFTFYGLLAYLALTRVRGWPARSAIVLSWLIFAAPVGFDRIATGRHWPLDVLVGYVVGIGLLSGSIWLHSTFTAATQRNQAQEDSSDQRVTIRDRQSSLAAVPIRTLKA